MTESVNCVRFESTYTLYIDTVYTVHSQYVSVRSLTLKISVDRQAKWAVNRVVKEAAADHGMEQHIISVVLDFL